MLYRDFNARIHPTSPASSTPPWRNTSRSFRQSPCSAHARSARPPWPARSPTRPPEPPPARPGPASRLGFDGPHASVRRESRGTDRLPRPRPPGHPRGRAGPHGAPMDPRRIPPELPGAGSRGECSLAPELHSHLPGTGHPHAGTAPSRRDAAPLLDHAGPLTGRSLERVGARAQPGCGRKDGHALPRPPGRPPAGAPTAAVPCERAQAAREVTRGVHSRQRDRPHTSGSRHVG